MASEEKKVIVEGEVNSQPLDLISRLGVSTASSLICL